MPIRIQRQRTKGWRMPEGAVYVGRPSRWGNPYGLGYVINYLKFGVQQQDYVRSRAEAVALYRRWLLGDRFVARSGFNTHRDPPPIVEVCDDLRGKDLVCWCPLGQPCHADVLLEIANGVPVADAAAIAADVHFERTHMDAVSRYQDTGVDA